MARSHTFPTPHRHGQPPHTRTPLHRRCRISAQPVTRAAPPATVMPAPWACRSVLGKSIGSPRNILANKVRSVFLAVVAAVYSLWVVRLYLVLAWPVRGLWW